MSDLLFYLLVIAILIVSVFAIWAIGIFDFILIVISSIIDAFFDD